LAVKIVRQPKKIALIGAPTSAAALTPGHERAPEALRAAGLVARLQSIGYEVTDLGDAVTQVSKPDEEHPRARNIPALVACLNDLRPRVEVAVKSGALPLIIGGDCSIALATVAGARRYFRHVGIIYIDRDADLNVPATSPSGNVDGMVVSHLIGRGAPELVRFWGEPPLLREPDIILYGIDRVDPPEEQALARSPIRRYRADDVRRKGATATAEAAADNMHLGHHEFILHFDVDAINSDEFRATNYAGPGGLSLADIQKSLAVFASRKNMAALEIATYNPALDPDGSAAKVLVELIAGVLSVRLAALETPDALAASASAEPAKPPVEAPAVDSVAVESRDIETPVLEIPEAPEAGPDLSSHEDSSDPGETGSSGD
jgi:arginase